MAINQELVPHNGIKIDKGEVHQDPTTAVFLKNIDFPYDAGEPGRQKFTPYESNALFGSAITLPAGTNATIGFHYSREVNRAFSFHYNSNGNHSIWLRNPEDQTSTKIIQHACLNFQYNPKHFIGEGRVTVTTRVRFNKFTQASERITILTYVDDFNFPGNICVEDAIATNGFTTAFFTSSSPYCSICNYIRLGVQRPKCIGVTPVQRNLADPDEADRPNRMSYAGWEFRVKAIDIWGEESEHGDISEQYHVVTGSSCLGESGGLPRCVDLSIDAGCPVIDKLQIEFRNCSANQRGVSTVSDWYLYDVIDKYDNSQNVAWYNRNINPMITYNAGTNKITYRFCADKQCTPLPVTETNRVQNPIPKKASSVFALGNTIALARITEGYEKMSNAELNKINITVTDPSDEDTCNSGTLRTITIYALIHNPHENYVVPIRRKDGHNVFGASDYNKNNPFAYNQVLPDGQEGFIGYLAGTKNYAVSKQVFYDRRNSQLTDTGLDHITIGLPPAQLNGYHLQKFEIKVIPGKYIFRIASHNASPTEDYQKTSTYYYGSTFLTNPTWTNLVGANQSRELVVDVCTADYNNLAQPILLMDLTKIGKNSLTSATKATVGYLLEDETSRRPIERASVVPNQDFNIASIRTNLTDYNGFYFAQSTSRGLQTSLYGRKNCVNNQYLDRSRVALDQADLWFRFDTLYAYRLPNTYLPKDRYFIAGKITLAGQPTVGVPGVLVNYTNGGSATTDTNGNFKLLAHNLGAGGTRSDVIIYTQTGGCQLTAEDDPCNFCFDSVVVNAPACGPDDNVVTIADLAVGIRGLGLKGPTKGARYGFGMVITDGIRESYIQNLDKHYVDIPSIAKTKVYEYSQLGYSMPSDTLFPTWGTEVSFYVTDNLNFDDALSWVAERVQFIDNSGRENKAAPTQIRVYYQSLNEYNVQNNLSTNTGWQFIANTANEKVIGDQVEFLINGDGTFFSKKIISLVKYDAQGKYFLIDYNPALKNLVDGALIKLMHPKQCESEEFFYQLCGTSIKLTNGVPDPTKLTGVLNVVDSYMVSRQIPVPVKKIVKSTDTDGNIIETSLDENQIINYPFLFEHHSPSDFWGDHCHGRGRVSIKNKYEKEVLRKMAIAPAKKVSETSVFNGLSYFDAGDRVEFPDQEWGGISLVFVMGSRLLVICENSNFIVGYDDNSVRVDHQGNVMAFSASERFGKPQPNRGSNFGCTLEDVNTARESNGIVIFLDTNKGGLIAHNFSEAKDISENGFQSWLLRKIKYIKGYNLTNTNDFYWHAGIDPKRKTYYLSVINLSPNTGNFLNDLGFLSLGVPETMAISIINFVHKGWQSFVPEYYGYADSDAYDLNFYTFRQGQAWAHHNILNGAASWNTFYGTICDKYITLVANMGTTKVKGFIGTEVYLKEHVLFCDSVITESGQNSRIMPLWFDRGDNFWKADFKCAIDTIPDANLVQQTTSNALLDGENLRGRWVKVRYKGKLGDRNKYFELTAINISLIPLEKSGQ